MLTIGLTGGIGCGKSTVRELLDRHDDTRTFDCDAVGKGILFSDNFRPTAERILGPDAFPNGELDVKMAASIIFFDAERRKRLEKELHPLVRLEIETAEALALADGMTLFVIEAAILFETGLDQFCDATVCAICNDAEQLRRLTENRRMTEDAARARISVQITQNERMALADLCVGSDCQMDELQARSRHLHDYLVRTAGVVERNEPK